MRLPLVLLLLAALALPGRALAYGWPLEPFDDVHAIRADFGDPRVEGPTHEAFHFGVDVQAPDGTPVYAVAPGEAFVNGSSVAVRLPDGSGTFGYWHIVPAVQAHEQVALHQLLGTIAAGWGHVHLSERRGGRYVNPLRPGALEPYEDYTSPTIARVTLSRDNVDVKRREVKGAVDVEVDAYDTPSVRMGAPWAGTRLTPAFLRWRVDDGTGRTVQPWRAALDFRTTIPAAEAFDAVYAPGTVENRAGRPGRYRFFVAHGWDTTRLADGRYRIEVEASDTLRNFARASVWFTVSN